MSTPTWLESTFKTRLEHSLNSRNESVYRELLFIWSFGEERQNAADDEPEEADDEERNTDRFHFEARNLNKKRIVLKRQC